ncbi:MAG TPA: hypothetical protein ENK83_00855 [Aliiroseovarius sp.]|nr:hypothetical protein [Aliiroseovarius sp.]
MLGDEAGRFLLFKALMVAGLVYSLPMLLEIRLSPQLNLWIYGYFQHNFIQMMREGGFRPIVFLYHGLWAAFFAFFAMSATLALARARRGVKRELLLLASAYLAGVLVLCKSLGSALYGAAMIPLILLAKPRLQIRLAMVLAALTFSYPLLKSLDLVPTDTLVSWARDYSEERGASLKFRIDNENVLFERARERPVLGWGSWGRNQPHHPITGELLTVTDGRWILTLGKFGWLGFLAEFGLLLVPIWLIWRQARRPGAEVPELVGPMTLMLAVNCVDLIPKATITTMTWLLAGSLVGAAEQMRATYRPPVPGLQKPPVHGKLETVL